MGPGVWENDVEEQYESSRHSANLMTPPPCFKYILLYIPGRGLLHDMGTLHLLHPCFCDSLRGKGVGMAASNCGTRSAFWTPQRGPPLALEQNPTLIYLRNVKSFVFRAGSTLPKRDCHALPLFALAISRLFQFLF